MPAITRGAEMLAEITRLESRLNELYAAVDLAVCTRTSPRINPQQALMLARLPDRGCEFSDLSRRHIFNGKNPSYPANELIGGKFLTRTEDTEDRRRRLLRPTPKGREVRRLTLDCLAAYSAP